LTVDKLRGIRQGVSCRVNHPKEKEATMPTINETIAAFHSNMVCKGRPDGTIFYCISHPAPEWMLDVVQEAHDGSLPDDWVYRVVHEFLSDAVNGNVDVEDEDSITEWADSGTDVYSHALWGWARDFRHDVEEFVDEFGWSGSFDAAFAGAQCMVRERIGRTLADAIIQQAEEEEDED
jgi:hypothetical protein